MVHTLKTNLIVLILAVTLLTLSEGAKVKRRRGPERTPKAGAAPLEIPGFINFAHKVASGVATIQDTRTISIKGFTYDGSGPDAFFLVGTGTPDGKGRKIANENGSYDVLEGYEGNDIELTLPEDLSWKDVDYLSVYCVSFRHNFGHIVIPKNLNVPEYVEAKIK